MLKEAMKDLGRGMGLIRVWLFQAYHELSAKYRRTALGSLWIAGSMVATSLAMSIVMGGIMGQNIGEILPYIMGGILCFALPAYILSEAPEVFYIFSPIIKNHAYPFTYYTFESVSKTFMLFFHNLVAYFIVMACIGKLVLPHWSIIFGLPIVYVTVFLWGSIISIAAARFSDFRFLLPYISQIAFFLTPVWWHAGTISGWRMVLLAGNPIYGLLEIVRAPLLGESPPLLAWELALGTMLVGFILWLFVFGANRKKIAFWV